MDFHINVTPSEDPTRQPEIELCPSLDGEVSQEYESTEEAWEDIHDEIAGNEQAMLRLSWEIREAQEAHQDLRARQRALNGVLDKLSNHL
jgi:chromosome segregation ATPase